MSDAEYLDKSLQKARLDNLMNGIELKVFHSLVGNSSVERLQVSHCRDLASEATDVFREAIEFYQWPVPKPISPKETL